ncbi:MAG: tyrosine-type recombinase/integrase [Crocinitomicaceae bacterium]
MEKARIFKASSSEGRVKFLVPFSQSAWRQKVKALSTSWYHPSQKLWSIANRPELYADLLAIFSGQVEIVDRQVKKPVIKRKLTDAEAEVLAAYEQKIILKGYSHNTLKNYGGNFKLFLAAHQGVAVVDLGKAEIEAYLFKLKTEHNYSDRQQHGMVNAVKFYYEQVLGRERAKYALTRPKKSQTLPNVLSKAEVKRLLGVKVNIKHKAIITLLYASGLRISEVTRLRLCDIHSDQGFIFIKGSKQKKDRHTVLSIKLLELLLTYFQKHKPSYWLFEGADGGQYSTSSINKIFRRMAQTANLSPWATPHTLRHSYATHLLQAGTNLRYIQASLGHSSSKTTEIYTHVLAVSNQTIKSPLDTLDLV